MVIGVDDAEAEVLGLELALALGLVVELLLLPLLLLQAARTLTESTATALRAKAFRENQEGLPLNAWFLLPRSGLFGVEPVGHIGVLTFEGNTSRIRLLLDESGEIDLTVAPADQSLNELVNDRGHGHRNLALPRGGKAEIKILAEQLRGKGRLKIQVHVRGC